MKFLKLYLSHECFGFMDLEKAIDMVPREVIKWAVNKLGVERLIAAVMSMYTYRNSCKNSLW